jgi:hypothetical protein
MGSPDPLEVPAYMVRLYLDEDGLTLTASNAAAALAVTGDRRRRVVCLRPEGVVAVRVTLPSLGGMLNGFLDISDGGAPYRVHFRKAQTEGVLELLRRMEQAGFPPHDDAGQRDEADSPQPVWDPDARVWRHG